MLLLRTLASISFLAVSIAACERQPARGAPSSDQTAFAEEYPARLLEVRTSFSAREQAVRSSFPVIRALPGKLRGGSPRAAAEVVRRADAAGRSSYYVEEALNQEGIARFMTEERAGVRGRIAGSVAFAAKEKECAKEDADLLGSTAASAAERAVQRELEDRLHERNEAVRHIDAQREALGERNVATLEQQADTISWSSYLTYVRLELYRRELEELVAEQANVKTTLERAEQENRAALASGKLSKARRNAVEQRLAAQTKARAAVDRELPPAEQELEALTDKLEALQADYRALLQSVISELERKEPAGADAATSKDSEPDRNADSTGQAR